MSKHPTIVTTSETVSASFTNYLIVGDNVKLTFIGGVGNTVVAGGKNDVISSRDTMNLKIVDHGRDLQVQVAGTVNGMDIRNWAHDPGATLSLYNQHERNGAMAVAQSIPDGAGGSIMTHLVGGRYGSIGGLGGGIHFQGTTPDALQVHVFNT